MDVPLDRSLGNPRLARRRLLSALAVFVVMNMATALVLDFAPLGVRFPEASTMLEKARQLPAPPDVLFIGSSIFKSLVDAPSVAIWTGSDRADQPLVFDASIVSAEPITMRFLSHLLEEQGTRPRYLVLELAPEAMAKPNPALRGPLTRFFRASDVVWNLPQVLMGHGFSRVLSTRIVPMYFFRRELLAWWFGLSTPYLTLSGPGSVVGQAPTLGSPGAEAGARNDVRYRPSAAMKGTSNWFRDAWHELALRSDSERAMNEILRQYTANGVKVSLVIPPASSTSRRLETAQGALDFEAYVQSVRRYGVSVVNYRTRLADDAFVDKVHANKRGASAFSRIVADELLRPWWIEELGRGERSEAEP